jgi:hypothetical protein
MEANMDAALTVTEIPNLSRWIGRVLSGIPVLFLSFDAAVKLLNLPMVAEASEKLGIPASLGPAIGVVLAVCVLLYCVPRTAVLGAVLLTGYLGAAVLVHARVGNPLFRTRCSPSTSPSCAGAGCICAMSGCAASSDAARGQP